MKTFGIILKDIFETYTNAIAHVIIKFVIFSLTVTIETAIAACVVFRLRNVFLFIIIFTKTVAALPEDSFPQIKYFRHPKFATSLVTCF